MNFRASFLNKAYQRAEVTTTGCSYLHHGGVGHTVGFETVENVSVLHRFRCKPNQKEQINNDMERAYKESYHCRSIVEQEFLSIAQKYGCSVEVKRANEFNHRAPAEWTKL